MRAKELLSDLINLADEWDREIDTVTDHSERATPNAIFVCIRGANADGHRYAASAYEKGCRIFLAEHGLNLPTDAAVILTESPRSACALVACKLYGNPSRQMQVIGITGTKGKTTVAQMITHILNQNGIPTGYIGTNGIAYGTQRLETVNTTPDPITLQRTLSQMLQASMQAVVLEVSSQALMQDRVLGIQFNTVLFTNLFPDHIGIHEHPTFEHYKACKRRLFQDFETRAMICNADDPASAFMCDGARAQKLILCSSKSENTDFYAENLSFQKTDGSLHTTFERVDQAGKRIFCDLPLIGGVNVDNALLALACAESCFGIPAEAAAKTLQGLQVSGRSEVIPLPNGACAIIDYAHNGDSLRQLLKALRAYEPNRLLCLFGSVGERTQQRRAELGKAAAEFCDFCILTSDNPGNEDPEQIMAEIETSFSSDAPPYVKIADREDAILYALSQTRKGDILVLAGKGHETYQLIGKDKLPFCEREILSKAIQEQLNFV